MNFFNPTTELDRAVDRVNLGNSPAHDFMLASQLRRHADGAVDWEHYAGRGRKLQEIAVGDFLAALYDGARKAALGLVRAPVRSAPRECSDAPESDRQSDLPLAHI